MVRDLFHLLWRCVLPKPSSNRPRLPLQGWQPRPPRRLPQLSAHTSTSAAYPRRRGRSRPSSSFHILRFQASAASIPCTQLVEVGGRHSYVFRFASFLVLLPKFTVNPVILCTDLGHLGEVQGPESKRRASVRFKRSVVAQLVAELIHVSLPRTLCVRLAPHPAPSPQCVHQNSARSPEAVPTTAEA